MSRLTLPEIAAAARLETRPADELLAWALGEFGDRFVIVTSFQIEGMVVVDLARRLDPAVRVITLDTGRLPEETYEVIETVRARFGVRVELVTPDPAAVAAMTAEHGPNLFRRDQALRRLCCQVRKVDPLGRPLAGLDAWSTGLRRDGDRPGPAPPRSSPTTPTAQSSSSTRWPTGPASGCGPTRKPARCPSIPSTSRATPASGARPAPGRCCPARTNGAVAGGGRPAPTRNAVCTTPAHWPASTGPWPSCGPTSPRAADPDRQP
jgi:hypothetical protein